MPYINWAWFFHGGVPAQLTMAAVTLSILVYVTWVQPRLKKRRELRRRRELLERTFELRIRQSTIHSSPGMQFVDVAVALHNPIPIMTFNMRFVESESGRDSPACPSTTIRLDNIQVQDLGTGYSRKDNERAEEGVTVRLRHDAFQKYPGEDMPLRLGIVAPVACQCYLSFQGFDAEGGRQYSRQQFTVT
jgi:hypothetical protein